MPRGAPFRSNEPQPEGKHSEAKNRADDDEEINLRPREGLAREGWDKRHQRVRFPAGSPHWHSALEFHDFTPPGKH